MKEHNFNNYNITKNPIKIKLMQNLKGIVDYYLKSNTNYALLITGEWGIGKTYYFKNILSKDICNTPTYNDDSKKYRPMD